MQKMKKGLIIGDGGNEEIQKSGHTLWDLVEIALLFFILKKGFFFLVSRTSSIVDFFHNQSVHCFKT